MINLCTSIGPSGNYARQNCRKTCNLCNSAAASTTPITSSVCADTANNCDLNVPQCNSNNASISNLMTQRCARTCNRCSYSSTTQCTDSHPKCNEWVRNGFLPPPFTLLSKNDNILVYLVIYARVQYLQQHVLTAIQIATNGFEMDFVITFFIL